MATQEDLFSAAGTTAGPPTFTPEDRRGFFYQVGGRYYPGRSIPACYTCQSVNRGDIETSLMRGLTIPTVMRLLPEESRVTPRSIRRHIDRGHMPSEVAVRQAMIEGYTREVGKAITDNVVSLVDEQALARLGVQKAYEALVEGRMELDGKAAVAFARLLHDTKHDLGLDLTHETMTTAFSVYMTATQAIMSPEQFRRFGQMLAANPVLNAMLGRVQSDGTTDVPGSAQDPPSEPKSTVLCPSVVMEESQPSSP